MAFNIVQTVIDELGPELMDAARSVTGLGADRSDSALKAGVPAVLAGIASSASSKTGATALASLLKTADTGMLGSLPAMARGEDRSSWIGSGIEAMSGLLGQSKLDKLGTALGGFVGAGKNEGRSLIGLLAPVALGVLGRQARSNNLGIDGVVNMLAGQRANIAAALPSGLADSIRATGLLDGLGDEARGTASRATGTAGRTTAAAGRAASARPPYAAAAREPRRGLPWAIVAVALAVIGIGWLLLRGPDTEPVRTAANDADSRAAQSPSDALRVGNVDVGAEFRNIADGLGRTMRSVTDEASANAALPRMNELDGQLDRLVPLTQSLPQTAKPAFADTVERSVDGLQSEARRVTGLEGVPDTFKETVGSINAKLTTLLATLRESGRG